MNERGNFRAYSLYRKKTLAKSKVSRELRNILKKVFDQFGLCILPRVWGREINVLKETLSLSPVTSRQKNLTAKHTGFADLGNYHTGVGARQKNSRVKNLTPPPPRRAAKQKKS